MYLYPLVCNFSLYASTVVCWVVVLSNKVRSPGFFCRRGNNKNARSKADCTSIVRNAESQLFMTIVTVVEVALVKKEKRPSHIMKIILF